MFDLHCHILPGLDDGPKTMAEALAMARMAINDGIRGILCTPHGKDVRASSSIDALERLATEVRNGLGEQGQGLSLLMGMENHLEPDLPSLVSQGLALTMNGSRYILVELPFLLYPNYADDVLFQLQLQGLVPVIAHAERCQAIQDNPERLQRLVERGMLSQITAGSLLGHFGKRPRKVAEHLLQKGLAHLLASDAHRATGHRTPIISSGAAAAARIVGEKVARQMVVEVPQAILSDLAVQTDSMEPSPRRRGFRIPWPGTKS